MVSTPKSVDIDRLLLVRFIYYPDNSGDMTGKVKAPEMRYQCLKCYKTHKTEQAALDCCGSMIQGWAINYNKWGRGHWYGR